MSKFDEVVDRLRRLETRLVVGFETLGIDTYDKKDWLEVDEAEGCIYVTTLGRSIQVINDTAKKLGAKPGKQYEIIWRDEVRGTVVIK